MVIATPTPLERNKRVVTINEKKKALNETGPYESIFELVRWRPESNSPGMAWAEYIPKP